MQLKLSRLALIVLKWLSPYPSYAIKALKDAIDKLPPNKQCDEECEAIAGIFSDKEVTDLVKDMTGTLNRLLHELERKRQEK